MFLKTVKEISTNLLVLPLFRLLLPCSPDHHRPCRTHRLSLKQRLCKRSACSNVLLEQILSPSKSHLCRCAPLSRDCTWLCSVTAGVLLQGGTCLEQEKLWLCWAALQAQQCLWVQCIRAHRLRTAVPAQIFPSLSSSTSPFVFLRL